MCEAQSVLTLQEVLQFLHCLWSVGGILIRLVGIQHVEDVEKGLEREEAVGKVG